MRVQYKGLSIGTQHRAQGSRSIMHSLVNLMRSSDPTLAYYDAEAQSFFDTTVDVDMSSLYGPFLRELSKDAAILDAGCGSGRDARAFRERGYVVTAMEPSPALAALAEAHCGLPVEIRRFQDIDWRGCFDGIWACASLLHVPLAELPEVLQHLAHALRPGGVLYVSFKYGRGEREHGGRRFTDLDEAGFDELLSLVPALTVVETWTTADRRPDREGERWLNVLLRHGGLDGKGLRLQHGQQDAPDPGGTGRDPEPGSSPGFTDRQDIARGPQVRPVTVPGDPDDEQLQPRAA